MKLLSFDSYSDYLNQQTRRNKSKIEMIAVADREMHWIAKYLKRTGNACRNGICHGVRNGFEVSRLRDLTKAEVIGTEISDTADKFPHVIQWDFHKLKNEWIEKFDFVYSNSWDHAFDPDQMLENWIKSLAPGGRCFLQWTNTHGEEAVSGADCFGLSLKEMVDWINSKYRVEHVNWLYEYSLFDLKRYYLNITRTPRPGIRGRKIAIVVVAAF